MSYRAVEEHYRREDVAREISEFSLGRWLAIHCALQDEKGVPIMLRYFPRTRIPLQVKSSQEFSELLQRLRRYLPRAFYASANIYHFLDRIEDTVDRENIVASTPTWDIDPVNADWEKVVRAAEEVIRVLDGLGVSRSIFVKWSGRGAHVHIHPEAFSPELRRRINPLDIAYSVTEYVALRVGRVGGVVVENRIDLRRVFTVPLSLHRKLDRVAVCIHPDKLSEFDPSWTEPGGFRHDPGWRKHAVGEADELAERAFQAMGPYIYGGRRRRVHKPLDQQINETIRKLSSEL